MKVRICPNCAEPMTLSTPQCPKCGIVPDRRISPVLIGLFLVVLLIVAAVLGILIF